MTDTAHLSLGKVVFETADVHVQEARDTITGTRVFVVSGNSALGILPNNHRILQKTANGALIVPPFPVSSAPRVTAPPSPAPTSPELTSPEPTAKPPTPKPAPKTPPAAQPKKPFTLPAIPKLPKLPRFTPYVLAGVVAAVVLLIVVVRQAPAAQTPRNASAIAHLVDVEVLPAGLPPVRLVVEAAPKGAGIEPGTVIGSVPKRVVFSHQGEWVVHGQFNDRISNTITISVPRDSRVTLEFPN